ncbi:MAG: ATP-binding protein, partial [Petrotogales bacterium]
VVGSTSPLEFKFSLKRFAAKLGDLVNVWIDIPSDESTEEKRNVRVWARITELHRFNPFLPAEAGVELADEGLDLLDTVLSNSRDQIEANALVLGITEESDFTKLIPLNYPVQPGAVVQLPNESDVQRILIGDEKNVHRLNVGSLIGRRNIEVLLKTNIVVARHMAILAMTGGGKTVVARRIIRELLNAEYPILILDPHGDYLGFWEKRNLFPKNKIKLFYPYLNVNERNRDIIGFLVSRMTQGFSDPQKEVFNEVMESVTLGNENVPIGNFLDNILQRLTNIKRRNPGTVFAVKRGLKLVEKKMGAMEGSNEMLRMRLKDFPFEPMPDPITMPDKFIAPGQVSILYLGGYDHITQSSIVALVLKHLFEERASMNNRIPPFLTVVEEAHNFIPSRGEGQQDTPSTDIIRKIITEGRKFGTGLLLISQRPSRLDETTLSQCNTFIVFRLVNPRDQSFVEKVMENLSKSDSKLLPGFGPGQGIVSGQAVRFPLVIQAKYDEDLVTKSLGDEDFLTAASKWKCSPEAEATKRSYLFENELKKAEET